MKLGFLSNDWNFKLLISNRHPNDDCLLIQGLKFVLLAKPDFKTVIKV